MNERKNRANEQLLTLSASKADSACFTSEQTLVCTPREEQVRNPIPKRSQNRTAFTIDAESAPLAWLDRSNIVPRLMNLEVYYLSKKTDPSRTVIP